VLVSTARASQYSACQSVMHINWVSLILDVCFKEQRLLLHSRTHSNCIWLPEIRILSALLLVEVRKRKEQTNVVGGRQFIGRCLLLLFKHWDALSRANVFRIHTRR
jgi:hypothetical protein